ncbi:MAG: hypothetical protein GY793_12165 [Proteobacteria bacterium]|nr:hypothetical protein [Pseudomonadota bacterium]
MKMNKLVKYTMIAVLAAAFNFGSIDSAHAGKAEKAVAMAEKADAYLKEHGDEKAMKAFTESPDFKDGEFYVGVIGMDGLMRAHGAKASLIGKDFLKFSDTTGKRFGKEIIEVKDTGWVEYHWLNPVVGKVQKKGTYVINTGKYAIAVGYYEG